MEHQTMSFMANAYPPLIGHELAHQWFGNMVTTDSWNHIWLNEGLATFSEAVARERIWPNEALRWRRENIESVTSEPGGSVRIPYGDTLNFKRIFNGRLSYQKGALILHMLRWKIGDSALFSGLRSYLNQAQIQYFYANSNQLTQAIDRATNQELDSYFSDWLYGEGYPSYQIELTQNNGYLNIIAHQTQSLETNFFELPIPVYVSGNGSDTIYRLEHRYSGQQFIVEVPFEVDSVAFDPEKWLISNENSISLQKGDLEPLEVFIDPYFEELRISTSNPYEKLDIYYIDGRLVYSNGPSSDLVTALPLQSWTPGVYLVRARIKGKDYSKKAIVPRKY
jgi:aminopeptidase N